MTILEEIVAYKKIEVEKSKERLSFEKLKKQIQSISGAQCHAPAGFVNAIKNKINKKEIAIIAEIKKASPSRGIIKENFNHIEIATAYKNGGATCLSVLTDNKYFQGNINYIKEIKSTEPCCNLPLLRKDFIIDPYQIYESIYYGADCILLIVGVFHEKPLQQQLRDLYEIACENKIDCLIEVHDEREMEIALDIVETLHATSLLGINNRDLKTFKTDLKTTEKLVNKYRNDLKNKIVVSESGIFSRNDISYLTKLDVRTFLIGESLMIKENIELALKELING